MAHNQQNAAAAAPDVKNLNMEQMLAALLASQAETARLQRLVLEREIARDQAVERKEAEAAAKLERLRKSALDELKRKRENDEARWKACPHEDKRGGSTIYPLSNHPDRRLRGVCTQCIMPIEPEHYEEDANGKKTLIPEHPLYKVVLQRDQALYSEFVPSVGY